MKTRVKRLLIVCLSVSAMLAGCDTDSTIDPPDESYFVKFYGGEGNQTGVDAVLNADGTVTLFGTTESLNSGRQIYLVNIEPNGRIVWEQTYGGPQDEIAKDIELTNDGRLAIVSDIENSPTDHDILVLTLTLDGSIMASDTIKFFKKIVLTPTDEVATSISQTTDGFIVAGSTNNLEVDATDSGQTGTSDALHVRYDNSLVQFDPFWSKTFGSGDAVSTKIIQISPTQFYLFGYSNLNLGSRTDINFFVAELSDVGEATDQNLLIDASSADDILTSVSISPVQSGEGYVLSGVSTSPAGSDIYLAKLRKDLTFTDADFQFPAKNLSINLGALQTFMVSNYASANSGFLVLANESFVNGVQNFSLTKLDNNGFPVWSDPIIFGGEMDDSVGAVLEFPDGSIGMVGTFAIGQDGETKMTFIKVNREGKFAK